MRTARRILPIAVAAVTLVAGACGNDDNKKSSASDTTATTALSTANVTGSLDATDQSSDGTTLTVASVTITGAPGWIAVHSDAGGAPGPVVGKIHLSEGTTKDVVIHLDNKVSTAKFWPMLHVDAGTAGTYEFPGADVPVKAGSDVVMKQITLTVA